MDKVDTHLSHESPGSQMKVKPMFILLELMQTSLRTSKISILSRFEKRRPQAAPFTPPPKSYSNKTLAENGHNE